MEKQNVNVTLKVMKANKAKTVLAAKTTGTTMSELVLHLHRHRQQSKLSLVLKTGCSIAVEPGKAFDNLDILKVVSNQYQW
ncbi:hypothetical protein CS542_00445 [Pedobacter sp. IW39]|nr:hypothetical protein CS542_00445 [Pedobacter sp. IW39]